MTRLNGRSPVPAVPEDEAGGSLEPGVWES